MVKMWSGRTNGATDKIADDFNSSIAVDSRMYRQDILGSIAHAKMLEKQNIINKADAEKIIVGLQQILTDIDSGKLEIDYTAEDVHMFIEQVLTERIGDSGKKLHTARSRNDQVALDVRLYLRDEVDVTSSLIRSLVRTICNLAEEHYDTIVPGYTHLQRAQPITFGHQLLAYAMMFMRDLSRLNDAQKRMNVSPIGSCALAGTTYETDRDYEAHLLGFDGVTINSIDSVSDRDFCVELASACSIVMMHLSRFSEEIILWSSYEFGFATLSDAYTTGSSIMPQKKNSDMAELTRGKTGRVYGNLMALLTLLKGIPLAYNKDMQEDKEAIFDSFDTVIMCLKVFEPMIKTMKVNKENMLKASNDGYINATDLADYLTKKGIPFRSAYKIVGEIVAFGIANKKSLEEISLDDYKKFSSVFENDLYENISMKTCVEKRISKGGTSPKSVKDQIEKIRELLLKDMEKHL